MRRLTVLLLLAAACSTAPHVSPAEAYLAALERDDLDTAWSLTSTRFQKQTDRAAYVARMSDPAVRAAHLARMRVALLDAAPELLDVPPPSGQPADAVRALARAARAGDFALALTWLAAAERARYTPERLARDFRAAPGTEQRLSLALAAVERPGATAGNETRWTLPGGGEVRVVVEEGAPRVLALE